MLEDIKLQVIQNISQHKLSWSTLTGVCTDGAPEMLGSKS